MALKEIAFVCTVHQDYVSPISASDREMARCFETISNSCLPILNMCASLEHDGVPFKLSLVLPPVLCTLLSDPLVRDRYVAWLDACSALGAKECARHRGDKNMLAQAERIVEKIQRDKACFVTQYGKDIVAAFAGYQKKGYVELLATTGTPLFMPHYADMEEILNAQVETGLKAHRYFFGTVPDGFWLPEMGYAAGIERVLYYYGISYTVLDAQSVLFSDVEPKGGIFTPVRCSNSLGVLARAQELDDAVFGQSGYAAHACYCNQARDIGFYLPSSALTPVIKDGRSRFPVGYSYWNRVNMQPQVPAVHDPAGTDVYDVEQALTQCQTDAAHFVSMIREKLSRAEQLLPGAPALSLVCVYDLSRMQKWTEGMVWFEQVIRAAAQHELTLSCGTDLFLHTSSLQKINPYYGASCGEGFGENLLSSKNAWMLRYIRKACARMIDLAERFPHDTGIKARLLNLGAKEVMLAQSLRLAEMIDDRSDPDAAAEQFSDAIRAFTTVFDSLGSNTVSTEWLTDVELRHSIFPWMNYRIFGKKR